MADDITLKLEVEGIEELKAAINDAAQAAKTLNFGAGGKGGNFGGFGNRPGNWGGYRWTPGAGMNPNGGVGGAYGPGVPPPWRPAPGMNAAGGVGGGSYGPYGIAPNQMPGMNAGGGVGGRPYGPIAPATRPSTWQQLVSFGRQVFFVSRAAHIGAAAFQAMIGPLEDAAKATREWNAAALNAGGASTFTMGNALGIGPGGAASAANSFRQRLASDPLAVMGFGRAMVPAQFGGDQDNSKLLREAIERLAHITDENTRIMKARQMGLESFLPMTFAPTQTRMMSYAVDNARNADAKRQRVSQGEASLNWSMGWEAMQSEHHLFGWLNLQASRLFRTMTLGDAQDRAAAQGDHAGYKRWGDINHGRYGKDLYREQAEHLSDNTEALKLLAGLLKGSRGTFGGGARAHSAIPPGLTGLRLQQAIQEDTMRLGGVVR